MPQQLQGLTLTQKRPKTSDTKIEKQLEKSSPPNWPENWKHMKKLKTEGVRLEGYFGGLANWKQIEKKADPKTDPTTWKKYEKTEKWGG